MKPHGERPQRQDPRTGHERGQRRRGGRGPDQRWQEQEKGLQKVSIDLPPFKISNTVRGQHIIVVLGTFCSLPIHRSDSSHSLGGRSRGHTKELALLPDDSLMVPPSFMTGLKPEQSLKDGSKLELKVQGDQSLFSSPGPAPAPPVSPQLRPLN